MSVRLVVDNSTLRLSTMGEVADTLRVSRRWLQGFIRLNPFYRTAGRKKLFSPTDIQRLDPGFAMPLRLVPPRDGKSTNWTIRGTHLGTTIDRTAGTSQRKLAARVLTKLKLDIEAGRLAPAGAPTFASATLAYVKAGHSKRFLSQLAEHFATTPLTGLDQAAIDQAAAALYPDARPATRNRQVYTPVSAILRHAGVAIVIRRPKGAQGTPRTAWLDPPQAFALMAASVAVGPTFGALVKFLTYTGARLGEALVGCRP